MKFIKLRVFVNEMHKLESAPPPGSHLNLFSNEEYRKHNIPYFHCKEK